MVTDDEDEEVMVMLVVVPGLPVVGGEPGLLERKGRVRGVLEESPVTSVEKTLDLGRKGWG